MWAVFDADTQNMVQFSPEFPFRRKPIDPAPEFPAAAPAESVDPSIQPVIEVLSSAPAQETETPEPTRIAPMFSDGFPFVRRSTPPAVDASCEQPSEVFEAPGEPAPNPMRIPISPAAPVSGPAPQTSAPAVAINTNELRMRDRRKVKRDVMTTPALIRLDGLHGPPMKVELIDISTAGVRFRAPRPLDAGEKAQIRIEVGPLRWTTRLRVVYSTPPVEGPATIGCAFLRTELLRPWPLTAA